MWERLDLVESQLFWEVRWDLESKKKLLILAEEEAMVSGNNSSIWHLKAEINILIDWESKVWNQRYRVLWLSKGDSNTKFFHRKSTKRFWRNSILGFKDTNGRWLDQAVDIGEIFIQYYNELFSTSILHQVQEALQNIQQIVTKSVNSERVGTFHDWEVMNALRQMAPLKALGPDGMSLLFYQHFWHLVDQEVTSSILS